MMYTREPVTPFELTDNQRDGNTMSPSLSGQSMPVHVDVAKLEHIYQPVIAKAHTNIKIHR